MRLWRIALFFMVIGMLSACAGAGGVNVSPTQQASTPTFSPVAGTYTTAQSVTISSATSGATIYYTTNGSTPTTSSTVYSSPVPVASSMTIKAIAAASGYTNSSMASAAYVINVSSGASGLPIPPASGVAKPSGAAGGLTVVNWAGFKSAITYTFDDALQSQIDNYAAIQATGAHVTFFLISSSDQSSPTWTQAYQDGHELGNHTAHHCKADGTSCAGTWAGSIEQEYDLCTAHIEQTYGENPVWTTASPYGDTGYDTVAATRFFLNRGVWGGTVAPNDSSDSYNMPIYGVSAGETQSSFDSVIDAARAAGAWRIFLFHSIGNDGGYASVNASDMLGSINYAKSLNDVWIDSFVNVGAYWAGQKAVTNATTTQSGSDTIVTWTLPAHFPTGKYVRVTVTGGTLKQNGNVLPWNDAGYYEVALDPGTLTISQ